MEAVLVGGDPVSNGHVVDALVGNLASQQLPHHNPITEKGEKNLQWFGQMTPWCFFDFWEMAFKVLGGGLDKRLLGADSALAPRSLLAR